MKVQVSPTARRQIVALAAWWDENRKAARVRVEDALEAAIEAMAEHPGAGPAYSKDQRYRTWRLKGTPYVLFYRVDEPADTIWGPPRRSRKRRPESTRERTGLHWSERWIRSAD